MKAARVILIAVWCLIPVLLLAGILLLTGCTSTYVTYETPNGSKLTVHRRSCLSRAEIPDLAFETNGVVRMSGYKNDGGSEAIGTIVKSAVKGGVEAAIGK